MLLTGREGQFDCKLNFYNDPCPWLLLIQKKILTKKLCSKKMLNIPNIINLLIFNDISIDMLGS